VCFKLDCKNSFFAKHEELFVKFSTNGQQRCFENKKLSETRELLYLLPFMDSLSYYLAPGHSSVLSMSWGLFCFCKQIKNRCVSMNKRKLYFFFKNNLLTTFL
jgi:hypothetical protein